MGYGCFTILGAQYLLLVVESMSMGVCLAFLISLALTISQSLIPNGQMETDHWVVIGYVSITCLGYLLTLAPYSYGLMRRKPCWVTPYLIWRMILTLLTIALGLSLCILLPQRGMTKEWTYFRVLPAVIIEVILGISFFIFGFLGMREFEKIQRHYMDAVRRRLHESYANIYRSKGNSTYSIPNYGRWPTYDSAGLFYTAPWINNGGSYYVNLK